jgi:hypothetical protein
VSMEHDLVRRIYLLDPVDTKSVGDFVENS